MPEEVAEGGFLFEVEHERFGGSSVPEGFPCGLGIAVNGANGFTVDGAIAGEDVGGDFDGIERASEEA